MKQISDGESIGSPVQYASTKADHTKRSLAARIALATERLRLVSDEPAKVIGLDLAQLRGTVEHGAVADPSGERLEKVVPALACWEAAGVARIQPSRLETETAPRIEHL